MNTKEDAQELVKYLELNGIRSKIIGSLKYKESSEHDIDIVIISPLADLDLRLRLEEMIAHTRLVPTDWGGLFFYGTEFGNVDIFFKEPRIGAIET